MHAFFYISRLKLKKGRRRESEVFNMDTLRTLSITMRELAVCIYYEHNAHLAMHTNGMRHDWTMESGSKSLLAQLAVRGHVHTD